MEISLNVHLARLTEAGYPASLLRCVAETLLRKKRNPDAKREREKAGRPVIVPYIHGILHKLKKVGR